MAHLQLVAGTAESDQVDARGALSLRECHEFGILRGLHDNVGQQRIVPVQRDIDVVGEEGAQVDPGDRGLRGAEHDVRQLGGDHRAAPAVGQARAQTVQERVDVIVVDAHVGAVEHLHALAVDTAGHDAQAVPALPARVRGPIREADRFLAGAEVLEHRVGDVTGDLVGRAVRGLDAEFPGQRHQLGLVPEFVAAGSALGQFREDLQHVPAVIRVRGGARRDRPSEIAGDDDIRVGAADAFLRAFPERIDTARSHRAVAAAHA